MTSVGMFDRGGCWGIPITTQTPLLALGGSAQKPGVVDGAPARFLKRLSELLESGYGLMTELIADG